MDHNMRRRWCSEISQINASLNPSEGKSREKSILDMTPTNMVRM